jgi:hypothetical protein
LNRRIISVTALIVLATTSPASLAIAQAPAPASKAAPSAYVQKAAGPTVAASKVGVSRAAVAAPAAAASDARLGAGRNVALMVVGGRHSSSAP